MNPRYRLVAQRAAHCCEYCGAPEALFNFAFEVEHVFPTMRGGRDEASNWALACRSCNLHKSSHTDGLDPESQTSVRLFHPRQDRWSDHFRLDVLNGRLAGLTSIGRATVNRLRMNSPAQVVARSQWSRLQMYPRA